LSRGTTLNERRFRELKVIASIDERSEEEEKRINGEV